ncbi:MAG: hypothetical protein ACI3VG_03915 [Oscillospiraceae bacterium]
MQTKINRSEYGEILGDRGADSLISPKQISSRAIVRYVRAMENTGGSAVLTIHKLRRCVSHGACYYGGDALA